jgi:hypothetical protein
MIGWMTTLSWSKARAVDGHYLRQSASLAVLALLLFMQPFFCVAHCAQMEALHHAASRLSAFGLICGAPGHVAPETAVPAAPSGAVASADASVPAYWVGILASFVLSLSAPVILTHIAASAMQRPRPLAWAPTPPPPR